MRAAVDLDEDKKMRPIDYSRMSPRDRMLYALNGQGLGRCGVVERNNAGAVTGGTTRGLEPVASRGQLAWSRDLTVPNPLRMALNGFGFLGQEPALALVPMVSIAPVMVDLGPPLTQASITLAPAMTLAPSQPATAPVAKPTPEVLPETALPRTRTIAKAAPRSISTDTYSYASGTATGAEEFDSERYTPRRPRPAQIPSQTTSVDNSMLPKPNVDVLEQVTAEAIVTRPWGAGVPWGKVAVGGLILGLGYLVWKKN